MINEKSQHPKATFKSTLFGETIRTRRLNQKKEDSLSSLNRLKKEIRSKFLLNMTNNRMPEISSWKERLWPAKCDKKDDPQVWTSSFPQPANSIRERKKLGICEDKWFCKFNAQINIPSTILSHVK